MQNKNLIIHLIREELRNKRLTSSLEELGFDCSYYMLNLSSIVLELAGFEEQTDELQDWYVSWFEKAMEEISYRNLSEMLDKWSVMIGKSLLEKSL